MIEASERACVADLANLIPFVWFRMHRIEFRTSYELRVAITNREDGEDASTPLPHGVLASMLHERKTPNHPLK